MEARSSAPGCFLSFDGTNESASSTRLKRLRKWVVIEDLLNRQICKGHSGSSPGHLAKGVVGRTEKNGRGRGTRGGVVTRLALRRPRW